MAISKKPLFARAAPDHPLTGKKVAVLQGVALLRVCMGRHLADLLNSTERAMRGHLADLYHLGLVERIGVPRALLAELHEANDPGLLYGSAPTIYTLSREGARLLVQAGLVAKGAVTDIPQYGPKNGYFLAHELQVKDVRAWLARVSRRYPAHLGAELWRDGKGAWIGDSRPDAVFRYRMREDAALTCLAEVDRGTERGPARWEDKLRRYVRLLPDEALLKETTGAGRVRVLVTAPTPKRRDDLWKLITDFVPAPLADRFWLCERPVLQAANLAAPVWRMAGRAEALPLVAAKYL